MSAVDGGPAFPVEYYFDRPEGAPTLGVQTSSRTAMAVGLSIRDYFAAKALQGALANSDSGNGAMEPTMMYVGSHPEEACELLATFAYRLADAMLAARCKGETA